MAELMLVNPRRRRRKTTTRKRRTTTRRRRRNPVAANPRKRTYRRRRNPARMNLGKIVQQTILPSATAAGGALGLDIVMGFLPLPAAMKTGPMRHVIKGAGAIGMGMLASMFVRPETAKAFTSGAMTVVMYDAGKEMVSRFMPAMATRAGWGVSGLGYYEDEAIEGLGYYGAGYQPDEEMMGLGYYEPEATDLEGMGLSVEEELEL